MIRWLPVTLLLTLLVAPLLLRPAAKPPPQRTVIVVSPHGEQIRYEFGVAFASFMKRTSGEDVAVDWRSPGGTNDITRMLDARYATAFAAGAGREFADLGKDFADAMTSDKLPKDLAPEQAARRKACRAAFLDSQTGCDHDVFFGGGEFPHRQLAGKGYLVDAGLLRDHADWFVPSIIPQTLSGETMYDAKGRYFGACLSVFGICASPERLAALGLPLPTGWSDLGDPRLFHQTTFSDPTRSAVPATTMERIIQERIRRAASAGQTVDPAKVIADEKALENGWRDAWILIKRLAGNARSVADGSSKAVRDVARGDAAAGVAIDFHGRSEADWTARESGGPGPTPGTPRLAFIVPAGGTSLSADPIALLRGAKHRDLAVQFMTFVLSPEGQRLWNYRVGTPGGPTIYNLRRVPIRLDAYTDADRQSMSDPDLDPLATAAAFTFRPEWTKGLYPFIGPYTKALCLDPLPELQAAWQAIITAGGPEKVPAAWTEFTWLPCGHGEAKAVMERKELDDPATRLTLLRTWTVEAIRRYRLAAQLAREGR